MARDGAGTYTAPAGQPVAGGTVIASATHNALVTDMGTELTDSLSRSGKGGMTSPLKLPDGAVGAPALTFTSDTNAGIYRAGADDVRIVANGADVLKVTTTGATVTGAMAATGAVSGTTGTFTGVVTAPAGAVGAPSYSFSTDTDTGLYSTGANSMALVAGGAAVVNVAAAGIKVPNGAVGGPSLSFTNDTTTGVYLAAGSDVRIAVGGADKFKATAAGTFSDVHSALTATSATIKGAVADGAAAVGVVLDNSVSLANAAARLVSIRNAGVELAWILESGKGSFYGADMSAQKITNLADGAAATDAATFAQATGAAVTLTTGTDWSNTNSWCHKQGRLVTVYLDAAAANPVGAAAWTSIAVLPAGARPAAALVSIPAWAWDANVTTAYAATANIAADGTISLSSYDNGTALVTPFAIGALDGVRLLATFVVPA